MVYRNAAEIDFCLADLPVLPQPERVLLTSPTYFEVSYVINPHMRGNIGDVDAELARAQWTSLKEAYQGLGISVETVDGMPGLPDMVFCANQTLPVPGTEEHPESPGVILSQMYASQRMPEVEYYADYFSNIGYTTHRLNTILKSSFEGVGDAIWHPRRRLIWGGYGFRTDQRVYDEIASLTGVPVCLLELTDPDFYHLDTCFSVLDENTVLIFPGVYDDDALMLIRSLFKRVLESPEKEARDLFSCNAHCPDEKHVFIQKGCAATNRLLKDAGFTPVELETSEFLKAGGSVFCMKQMFW